MNKYFNAPTKRVLNLKERFINAKSYMCCERAKIYTRVYKEMEGAPTVLKRGIALRACLNEMPIFIEKDELILGHPASLPRSAEVFPEVVFSYINELDDFETRAHNRLIVTEEVKAQVRALYPYWEGRTLADRFKVLRPEEIKACFSGGLFTNSHEVSGFAHVAPDFSKILKYGIKGMLQKIEEKMLSLDITSADYSDKMSFYRATKEVCLGTIEFANRYSRLAKEQANSEQNPTRKAELLRLSTILSKVPFLPATSYDEAIQSYWIIQLVPQIESNGYSISPGRFDQYMYPYLKADLDSGAITKAYAQELLDCLFLKYCEILRVDGKIGAEITAGYASGQNLVVSGFGQDGKDATNLLTYMCLEANAHIGLHQPNFTVRLHKDSPVDLLKTTVHSIATGNGMPQVLNDDVIIPAVTSKGIPLELAIDYLPIGCDEITVYKMWGRCNGGYVNMPKILEATLGGGYEISFGKKIGDPVDLVALETFDDLMNNFFDRFKKIVALHVCEANLTDNIHRDLLPLPFVSLLVDDCIDVGRDVTNAGARYNTTGLVAVGSASVGDSLVAIKRLVYDEKLLSLADFAEIVRKNFDGNELLRQRIINKLPKFGNDCDEVDNIVVDVTNFFFDELEKYKNSRGGAFWPALYSVTAQVALGNVTAATPDGRLAFDPLSDGLTPMYGADKLGPTAALKSVCKVDLSRAPDGVIVNQRLMGTLFENETGVGKLVALLKSFVAIGGFHWQFNIFSNEVLKDAIKNPENYKGLVVRVAGYSAIFVELSEKAQKSIIDRSEASL